MKIHPAHVATHPFLKGLSSAQVETLLREAMPVEYPAGTTIFHEGEPANRFYLIIDGEVELEFPPEEKDDAPYPVATLGAGDVLGWSWLFPPYYWHLDAHAVKDTTALFIYGTRIRELCENDHELGYQLMKRTSEILIRRLQATRAQFVKQGKALPRHLG